MAKSLTVKNIIEQVEHSFGRQPEAYLMRIINDALLDISEKKQHYIVSAKQDLVGYDRWYSLTDDMIDVIKVEILDTNSRYIMIPKLTDPHKLLRGDTDDADDSLT
tara:strand:- start:909 stop:1226 length:318 start_codon:yes stop_codon:yes gene_type:complete